MISFSQDAIQRIDGLRYEPQASYAWRFYCEPNKRIDGDSPLGQQLRHHVEVDDDLMKPNRPSILRIGPFSSNRGPKLSQQYKECVFYQRATYNNNDLMVRAVYTPVWKIRFFNHDASLLDKDDPRIAKVLESIIFPPRQRLHPPKYNILVRIVPDGSKPIPIVVLPPQARDITGQ